MGAGVASRLASALGRRDEEPNIALAETLAKSADKKAIAELAGLLSTGSKPERHDAIKVIYELGERRPKLIRPHINALFDLLGSRDNRMIWGTISALDTLADEAPKLLMARLNDILDAADRSSVIAKDKTTSILSKLNANPAFAPVITAVTLNRLKHAAVNQFPMYAEFAAATISDKDRPQLVSVIEKRLKTISYPAKCRRLEKLLRKLAG